VLLAIGFMFPTALGLRQSSTGKTVRKYGMETARYGTVDTTCLEVTCAAPCRDIDACIQIREVDAGVSGAHSPTDCGANG
jgi:hypothetical protein